MARDTSFDLVEDGNRRANLARRAITALITVMLYKGRLHRVQMLWRTQSLDGGDVVALVHHREGETRINPPSVDDHRASTTLAVIAAFLGAGEMQVLA